MERKSKNIFPLITRKIVEHCSGIKNYQLQAVLAKESKKYLDIFKH